MADEAASLHAFRTCLSRAEGGATGDGISSATFVAVVEELGLLGAKLLPSEGGHPETRGDRLRSVSVSSPAPATKPGKKGKAAESRTVDPEALAALELQWREQRKSQLSLQLLGLTWQQNAAKIQARLSSRGCNPTH